MLSQMRIDHIGYAVKNMDKAVAAFSTLGYRFEQPVDDISRNLRICFGTKDGYRVELLTPLSNEASPADAWLKKVGPTPYHICYRAADFDKVLAGIVREGFRMVVPAKPAVAFSGRRVAFLFHVHIGLIEIVEEADYAAAEV